MHYPMDLGLQEANNFRGKLSMFRQHRECIDRVLGRIIHHTIDLCIELAQ